MKIDLKCKCGSTVSLNGNHYIQKSRKPDEEGRIFQVEVYADKWKNLHKYCMLKPVATTPDCGCCGADVCEKAGSYDEICILKGIIEHMEMPDHVEGCTGETKCSRCEIEHSLQLLSEKRKGD